MPNLIADLDHMSLLALGVAAALALIVLLRWTGERVVAPQAAAQLAGDGGYDYAVAGSDEHQPVLGRIAGRPGREGHDCTAELVPDVARTGHLRGIWVLVDGARVGHIKPGEMDAFNAVMDGRPARCEAIIVGEGGLLGVRLDTAWPPRMD